ncbi:hypothetical protein CXB51_005731 [Gossypium anomalum]|uniref:Aminotransferase-like plant mobile domain-containing protein n=1 Tax=Gossypium anomalum TaxID=47600 RepID=A0A8J5ZE29_9ROSI|nr:hypothetical protein CXB51_005731 [Gossypium anomalum]
MPYLKLAGFEDVALIRRFDLRVNLISALVEQWCTVIHTFIMPCVECTITLEDVTIQLGNGEQNFTCLTLAWLRVNFKKLSSTATKHKVICAARAYIMQLIGGGVLMPNNTSNRVHLKYLPLLEDFSRAGSYSWGSIVLAILYHELCRATKHGMGHVSENWCEPNISHLPLNDRGFLWMSYSAPNIATLIPQWVHTEAHVWCINTPMLNFSTVEWNNDSRVMQKFGCRQFVPVEPQQFADVHDKTMRGKHTIDWNVEHQLYVALWNAWYEK